MIFDFKNKKLLRETILKEKLDICVISYGGSCSNQIVDLLEKNGYKCRTKLWCDILCHCPEDININIPIIYIYDNPIKSFLSMRERKKCIWKVNQKKLSNGSINKYSDENLLRLMIRQFNIFCNKKNILIVKSNEIFLHSFKKK